MDSGTGHCFISHEGQAKRGQNEIGSCVNIFLKKNSFGKPIIFNSDNCMDQNKNKFTVSLYMYTIMSYNIPSHKYLITGHTQNEGNHMSSLNEKQKECALRGRPTYIPAQWVIVIRCGRKLASLLK